MHNELVLLFIILAFGSLLGRIRFAGINLSTSGGVLFIALAFGHYGFSLPDNYGNFGFALFIYAIGFGAGPRFFTTFRKNGLKFGLIAVWVATIASVVAFAGARIFHISFYLLPGILAGALTSTSTLAAAYELVKDPSLSVGYGITYPFGLIGLLLLIQYLPDIFHIDLKKEAENANLVDTDREDRESRLFQRRVFQVQNPGVVATPLKDLNLRKLAGIGIITIKHGDHIELANADSQLQLYDRVLAEGRLENLLELSDYLGPEVADKDVEEEPYATARVVISRKKIIDHSLRELRLPEDLNVQVIRIQRGGVDIPVRADIRLERGDLVTLGGNESNIRHAVALLGRQEHKIFETDMFTFSAGLLAGLLLGMVKLPIINVSFGNAGALLFMGIILGYLRNFGPFSGRVPMAARYILQELGLLLFMAVIGVQAGHGLIENLKSSGLALFTIGAMVTIITLITTLLFCRYFLKFDWNTSFGATTGGVTSTVALQVVTEKAESQYAVLGYAGVYAFANILLTMLGQIIIRLSGV